MRSFRFSLRTLLLATVIVALCVALWVNYSSVGPLRSNLAAARTQIRKLQSELGRFPEVDPELIQAMLVGDAHQDLRRFRIFLPTDTQYYIHVASGHFPVDAVQSRQLFENQTMGVQLSGGSIGSGEFTLDVQVAKEEEQWEFRFKRLADGSRSGGLSLSLDSFGDWLDDRRQWWVTGGVGAKVVTFPKDGRLVLYGLRRGRLKEFGGGHSVTLSGGSADGIVVWIDTVLDPWVDGG